MRTHQAKTMYVPSLNSKPRLVRACAHPHNPNGSLDWSKTFKSHWSILLSFLMYYYARLLLLFFCFISLSAFFLCSFVNNIKNWIVSSSTSFAILVHCLYRYKLRPISISFSLLKHTYCLHQRYRRRCRPKKHSTLAVLVSFYRRRRSNLKKKRKQKQNIDTSVRTKLLECISLRPACDLDVLCCCWCSILFLLLLLLFSYLLVYLLVVLLLQPSLFLG